ncbi:P-loop containing nucleoside triphosphate hydrolase protein [Cryomyces antarcticus]|nr:DNA repair helicase RAD25 [Cryomyces antarcticus]
MPPKRKATTAAGGRAAKRVASGVNTPVSMGSSEDDYTDTVGAEASETEAEDLKKLISKFSASSYRQKNHSAGNVGDAASRLFKRDRDLSSLTLKPDHVNRPLWLDPDRGRIVMETFSPSFKQAQNFLINVAEPQSRTTNVHEYTITGHSLFAAVSVGLTTNDIIRQLEAFSKTKLPEGLKEFIVTNTQSFGKVRLVLKHNSFYIESQDAAVLQTLLRDEVIGPCRIEGAEEISTEKASKMAGLVIPGTKMAAGARQANEKPVERLRDKDDDDDDDEFNDAEAEKDMTEFLRDEDDDDETDQVHSFQVPGSHIQKVQERCNQLGLPLTEEYDFRNDDVNANLVIDLKPTAQIRYYQEHALNKMFGNGRARSGIIVLPCGAGKTLVGITAACTVKKSVIVLCTSGMSVVQWRAEFLKWSNINPDDIATFTSDHKDKFNDKAGIIICTYSMVTQASRRAHDSQVVMDFIMSKEWGLMILDEVHVVPAEMFRKVTEKVATHSKLGLTATLLREDDKIKDLNFLIGPKLYEANWLQLSEEGHIARVQCAEVWCPMTTEFYTEYLRTKNTNKRSLLSTMNPRKYQACQFLIDFHERRGDKVIVFSDNVYALKKYALKLGKAFIYGDTPPHERIRILENFQLNPDVNTIFLSKIGDTSLDLPEATCLIQVSSHYGSRRQEAQRLGRILRAKRRNDEGFNAFFYSLVSKDTNEMFYSSKRQAFLVDQGYAFKVITHLNGIDQMPKLAFSTGLERRELLTDVMLQNETAGDVEKIEGDLFGERQGRPSGKKGARRTAGTLSELSGGQDMAYVEYNKSRNKELKGKGGPQNAFIRKLKRDAEKRKAAARSLQ